MLSIKKLSKTYAQQPVVHNLSVDVASGEVLCLLGSNGAGKSTTLKMLLGLVPTDGGTATLDDIDLLADTARARREMLYIPERVNLYADLSAHENLTYLAALAGLSTNAEMQTQALTQVGLDAAHHHTRLSDYSKGMRQKVMIAFALLKKARLLLLDEPTSGLDPVAIQDFIRAMRTLRENNCSVLMVTHDLQCAYLLADRIAIMHNGSIQASTTPSELSFDALEKLYFTHIHPLSNES